MKNSNLYKKDGQSTIYMRWNRIYDISWYIVFLQLRKLTFFVMTLTVKPIFHWKWGSRWVPNANEIYTKYMKCTWPMPVFCVGTQRNLYSTDWRQGLASGKTQILAQGNAKIYQHVDISNAKFWRRGHCPTPTPDARYFASQWNMGFIL